MIEEKRKKKEQLYLPLSIKMLKIYVTVIFNFSFPIKIVSQKYLFEFTTCSMFVTLFQRGEEWGISHALLFLFDILIATLFALPRPQQHQLKFNRTVSLANHWRDQREEIVNKC